MPAALIVAFEFIGASTALATLAANMVITFAVSSIVSRLFAPKMPSGSNQSLPDQGVRQQIPPSTTNSLPIVYGDAYLGGTFVDAALSQDQKYMWYVLAISSISPNGQFSFDKTNFYYGDRKIGFDTGSGVVSLTDGSGNVDTSISGNFNIWLFTSSASGTITPLTGSLLPHQIMAYSTGDPSTVPSALAWASSNRQMNGLAFAIVKLHYNQQAGITGLQPITFKCQHYLNSQGCAKAGDVWADYLANTNYGGAVSATLINTASATALNSYGDQLIPYTNNSGSAATMPRYRINGVLDTSSNVLDNIDRILVAADSWMAYNAALGQWSIVINKDETPSFHFDDNNIIGEISVGAIDINQSVNQIQARYPNGLNKDISDFVYLETPSYLLYANEPVNKQTVDFNMVNNNVTAQYLANRILEQAREDLTLSFSTTYDGIQVNAGDVVSVTNDAYGWDNKLFRVMKVDEASLPNGNLGASLQMLEYNAQVYDNATVTQYQPASNSGIPYLGYFGSLVAPVVSDQQPNAAVPSFSVDCTLPSTGQILQVTLYYTTVSSPSSTDWIMWGVDSTSNSTPYTNGSTLKFPHIGLPTGTYYFAFKVGNNSGNSALSAISSSYAWSPNPSTSAVAGTFIADFSPPNLSIPYNGSPTFTGIFPKLYGTTAGGSIDFVASQTDSDSLFVNNTWRIGGSSTTGYADIVKTGITIGNPTDGGYYAIFPSPTAMASNPATIDVPVRYKSAAGVVSQGATATLQLVYAIQGATGTNGANGNKTGVAYLYQWSTATPSNPNGYSTFTWSTVSNATYTGGNGWTTTIPTNPATAGISLWQAAIGVTDTSIAVTTTVSWATGFSVNNITQNGVAGSSGTQSAFAIVYKWALTIPTAPTGSATYTWSTGLFTPTPSGWSLSPSTSPSLGYTLWEARVRLIDSATATSTTVNWTTSTISAVGYSGTNGASSRNAYTKTTLSALATTPATIPSTGTSSFPANDSWGTGTIWGATAPSIVAGESVYQSDGIYDPSTDIITWNVPYLSTLKVGSLSAISANLGSISSGNITLDTTSSIKGGQTAYNTGTGFFLGYSSSAYQFSIGNPSGQYFAWNGTNIVSNGLPKQAGLQVFTSSTTFNVPLGIYVVYVAEIIGGGGGGARGSTGTGLIGGGGGSGEVIQWVRCPPTGTFSGLGTEVLSITIGSGGGAGTLQTGYPSVAYTSAKSGGDGTASSVALVGGATYVTAAAGQGGYNYSYFGSNAGLLYNYGAWQGISGNQFTKSEQQAFYFESTTSTLYYQFNPYLNTWHNNNGAGHILGEGSKAFFNRGTGGYTAIGSAIYGTGGGGGYITSLSPTAGQSGVVVLQW
jgi:hypothetical protein